MCTNTPPDENNSSNYSFGFKKKVIQQITNGRISKHHASRRYDVPRSTLNYWLKKWSTLEETQNFMSQKKKIKELEERIEELEAAKELQQEMIVSRPDIG